MRNTHIHTKKKIDVIKNYQGIQESNKKTRTKEKRNLLYSFVKFLFEFNEMKKKKKKHEKNLFRKHFGHANKTNK